MTHCDGVVQNVCIIINWKDDFDKMLLRFSDGEGIQEQ